VIVPTEIADMQKNIFRLHHKSSISESLSLLRIRAAVAGRVVGGVARAMVDPDRMQELWHRLQDYDHYDRFRGAIGTPRRTFAGRATLDVPVPMLVTSNSGLYLLERDAWHCLLPVTCFGVARHEDRLYVGASAGLHSFVLSAEIVGKESIDGMRNVKVLARYETRYHNERIHQIAYDARAHLIHCANCRRNSLLAVDPGAGGIVDEKFLFIDPSGSPFFTDQNHVNAVTVNGDALLFATRYAGSGGGLGFVANDTIRVYQYPAVGVHDVVIHDNGIMFTDSFRENSVLAHGVGKGGAAQSSNPSGAIRFRGAEYLTQGIDTGSRRLVLRGLAMRGEVLAVGFSAWARRAERMTVAGGGLILFRGGNLVGLIDGPFGQVFDVLPLNGARTDAAGPVRSFEELDAMFRRDVGPLLFEAPLPRGIKIAPLR
jgi:hypothetical protein